MSGPLHTLAARPRCLTRSETRLEPIKIRAPSGSLDARDQRPDRAAPPRSEAELACRLSGTHAELAGLRERGSERAVSSEGSGQLLAQCHPGAVQARFHGGNGFAERVGCFFVGEFLHVAENEDSSIAVR